MERLERIRSFIRRTAALTASAGTNTNDIDIFEGEIVAAVTVRNTTNSCEISSAYHQGGNAESAVVFISDRIIPVGGAAAELYPLGRVRVRAGQIHSTWNGCLSGDSLTVTAEVEARAL